MDMENCPKCGNAQVAILDMDKQEAMGVRRPRRYKCNRCMYRWG